jgi:hypothetical protein
MKLNVRVTAVVAALALDTPIVSAANAPTDTINAAKRRVPMNPFIPAPLSWSDHDLPWCPRAYLGLAAPRITLN